MDTRSRTRDIRTAAQLVADNEAVDLHEHFLKGGQLRHAGKRRITAKSANQRLYLDAIEQHDIVFGIGPAGTGKTYLAMAQAVSALLAKKVERIILARPAVEAGEKLGFLPGDLQEKVNPYLRPLYDALYDMLDVEQAERLLERGTIEVAPIAFMRGRTLNDAFVILDEAQNTTIEQMKMFLTRLGLRLQGRGHRRHHPDRSADRPHLGPDRRDAGGRRASKASPSSTSTSATWCATSWCRRSSRPTSRPHRRQRGPAPRPWPEPCHGRARAPGGASRRSR